MGQLDFDNTYDKGTVMSVACDINEVISIYPTLTDGKVSIELQSDNQLSYDIMVGDMMSSIIYAGTIISGHQESLDLSSMPAGVYMIYLIPHGSTTPKLYKICKK